MYGQMGEEVPVGGAQAMANYGGGEYGAEGE